MSSTTTMSTMTSTMVLNSHQSLKVSSTTLEPPRPQYARQRSNSLPPGLANMNAQEAGMLFSAAERATARRRRPISVHTSYGPEPTLNPSPPFHVRLDSSATIKPIPPPKDTPPAQQQPTSAPSTVISRRQTSSRALRDLDISQAMNGRSPAALVSTLKSLPVPILSPTKRQVGTNSLKSYADQLFEFTQIRLVSTIPDVLSPPPTALADVFDDGNLSTEVKSPSRPSLESKFSDWSVTTCETRQSRIQETELLVPALAHDSALMSPDSFFGGYDDTPRKPAFNSRGAPSGYPSSEAYGPQPGEYQPLTPPCETAEPIVSPVEEFSYFTNYDQYIDTSTTRADIQSATQALEDLAIEISPLGPSPCALTPSSMPHADTSIRSVLSQPCIGTPVYAISPACSGPSTPYQMADVAVRVPNWLIGAIG